MISYEEFVKSDNNEIYNLEKGRNRLKINEDDVYQLNFIECNFNEILEQCYVLNIDFERHNIEYDSTEHGFKDDESFILYSKDKKWVYIYFVSNHEFNLQKLISHTNHIKYFSVNGLKTNISELIFTMRTLRYLELKNCIIHCDLKKINSFSYLKVLSLDGSDFNDLPSEIGDLNELNSLSLMHTNIANIPQTLEKLTKLRYLGLNGIKFNNTVLSEIPEAIFKLTELSSLFLGQTNISKLPEGMKKLKNLEHLALWETEISELPDWICEFTKLKGLYLGRSKRITNLPKEIGSLALLRKIYIDGTEIKVLPDSFGLLKNLEEMILANTPIRKFPILSPLPNLNRCNLNGMILERIPQQIINDSIKIHLNENYSGGLTINNTTILCQPISLFSHDKDFINAYYAEDKIHLNETKVVFLGDGEAGKSHIIERIKKNGAILEGFNEETTPGIAISEKNYQIKTEDVKLQIWDFGGQEIMHSMHRFFLTDRTLYVIIVNARDNTQDERTKYWLNNVKSFANGCPVILVLNKIDQNPSASLNERLLVNDYPQIVKTIKTSALKDSPEKFNQLSETIIDTVKTFDSYAMEFPISWNKIKNELIEMEDNYIVDFNYRSICNKNSVIDEQIQNWLLDWFHDLGVSFNYHKKDQLLGGYIILKPHWITNAIYIILFNGSDMANNGIISIKKIINLLKCPPRSVEKTSYNINEVPYILGVMRKFEISYAIDDEHEFIPMMCIKNQHIDAEKYAINNNLEYVMEYEYLPNNVLHKLMIKLKDDIVKEKIWLTGMILESREDMVSALVRMHDKHIEIFIRSKDFSVYSPKEYLTEIRKYLLQINEELNLKAEDMVIYKESNLVEAIKYNILLIHLSSNQLEYFSPVFRKLIPIKKILGLVENDDNIKMIMKLCSQNKEITYPILQNILNEMKSVEISQDIFENDLIQNCIKLQGNTLLIQQGKENDRNTYLRDLLSAQDYLVFDQTLNGISPGGKSSGELDLLIKNQQQDPFAILEALNLKALSKDYIAEHINKVYLYDTWGSDNNYLVVYVEIANFINFTKRYKKFIETFEYKYPLQCVKERTKYTDIHVYDSLLHRNDKTTVLTHILVRI